MKHAGLLAEFASTPWALMPERLAAFQSILSRWHAGIPASPEVLATVEADREARDARRQTAARAGAGGIAVLPFYGVVTQRGNMVDAISGPGSVSTQMFTAAFREAMADDTVGQILIDIDSPGGSVYGVAELAEEIYQARASKPVVAVANSLAASAAYWVAASCTEVFVTPSGEVGSIGVWQAHQDVSAAMEAEGVKVTMIQAGKFKTEGNPYSPLDPEAQTFMQSRVNDYYGAFTKAVARGRAVGIDAVRGGMGEGRVLGADQALAEKMVDGVATFDDVVKRMQRAAKQSSAPKSAGGSVDRARRALVLLN